MKYKQLVANVAAIFKFLKLIHFKYTVLLSLKENIIALTMAGKILLVAYQICSILIESPSLIKHKTSVFQKSGSSIP